MHLRDALLQRVFNALLDFEHYDAADAGISVTVRADLIEAKDRQGMSTSEIAHFIAAIDADAQAMIAGKGESELLRTLREEELNAYELREKGRIASVLGVNVDELSSDALRHMWEEIPVVIRTMWNEKPWLSKQPVQAATKLSG